MVRNGKKKRIRRLKALLILHGISGVDIARELDVSPKTVYVVLGGYGTSQRIQKEVYRQLKRKSKELTYDELWGQGQKSPKKQKAA